MTMAYIYINTAPINYNEKPKLSAFKTNFAEDKIVHTPHGFDACYNKNTFFLDHFNKKKRFYGLHMLIHQAVPCFHKWYGVMPEVDTKLVALLEKALNQ